MSGFKTASRTIFCGTALAFALLLGHLNARGQDPPQEQSASASATAKQLLTTRACVGCDLSNVDLTLKDLSGVDLSGARLVGTVLYKTNLTGANLTNANMVDANLAGATLTSAKLANVDFSGANLRFTIDGDLTAVTTTEKTTCPDNTPGPCR